MKKTEVLTQTLQQHHASGAEPQAGSPDPARPTGPGQPSTARGSGHSSGDTSLAEAHSNPTLMVKPVHLGPPQPRKRNQGQ